MCDSAFRTPHDMSHWVVLCLKRMQMSSQAPPQHLFSEMPMERKSTDEDRDVQRPGMPAPYYSQEPSQETQLGQAYQPPQQEHRPEEPVSAAPVPFEKVCLPLHACQAISSFILGALSSADRW